MSRYSPHHRYLSRAQRGFTLLEVTIALALLALTLTILLESQGQAVFMSTDSERVRLATMLAEEKMAEAQLILEAEGWTTSDIEESGDFDSFGQEDFRQASGGSDHSDNLDDFYWAYTIRRIEINLPSDLGGLSSELTESGYLGDQQQETDNGQMDLGDLGITPDKITEYLADYIREVRVLVWWGEKKSRSEIKDRNPDEEPDNQVELLTHIINPTGVVSTAEDTE
jgi:prepilin-type N-terminal cleavage/methylation domain-containing protein